MITVFYILKIENRFFGKKKTIWDIRTYTGPLAMEVFIRHMKGKM